MILSQQETQSSKDYKTFETTAIEIKMDISNMVFIGMYRSPKAVCGEYQILVENELSDICNWASVQNNFIVILGDLNLDGLRPDKREGKLLTDMEMSIVGIVFKETGAASVGN